MGVGSAAASPYGNGGGLVNDMIGPAYATVKLVADNMTELLNIEQNISNVVAAGELVTDNLVIIEGSVAAAQQASDAAASADISETNINALVITANGLMVSAQAAAAAAAASALEAENIAGANFLDSTGGTVTGNIEVTGWVSVAAEAFGAGWDNDLTVPTKNDVYDKIKAMDDLKGVANGYVMAGPDNKVPLANLPDAILGAMKFQDTWNANTNIPAIPAATVNNKGHYYIVATAGATPINGETDWQIGDWLISNGASWTKIDNTDKVSSVNGQTGVVVITKATLGLGNVDNTSDANKPVSDATQAALDTKAPITPRRQAAVANVITPTFLNDSVTRVLTGATTVNNPTGTPVDTHGILFRFEAAGAYPIEWGAQFRAIGSAVLPTVTVPGKTHYIGAVFNADDTKWDVLYTGQEN